MKKNKKCILITLICILIFIGCAQESKKDISILQNKSEATIELEEVTVPDEEQIIPYLRKIWVIDTDTGEEGLYSTPFSFYITSVDNGIIEGKYQIGHGIIRPECYQKGYKNGFKDRDEVGSFKGEINSGIIKCDFGDKNGNEGEIDFLLWEDACIKAEIKCTKSSAESEDEGINGTYCFRPYNLSDMRDITISDEYSFETELDSWGYVRFVSARLDNYGEGWYYPVTYLTDLEGNILYEFYSGYKTGSEVSDVVIEDMNGDGLKDIGIITLFTIYAEESDFYYSIRWNLYQMEDGRFYLNDSVENINEQNVKQENVNGELSWKWVIEPEEYQMISFDNNGLISVVDKEGKYGVFNSEGEVVVPFCYDYISKFNYGIAEAELNGEAFYINEEGELLWDRKYDEAFGFQEEMSAVQMENLWGFIDLNGEMTIPCQYDEVKNFSEGMAAVKKNDKWGFIDKTGELFVNQRFDEVRNFQEGFSAVKMDGKWGFVDSEGRLAVECIYDKVKDFQEGHAAVMKDNKWGFIDNTGLVRIDLQFDDAGNFSEGKAAVKVLEYKEGMDAWAYINESGEIVIDYDFYFGVGGLMNYVGEFRNGVAFVSKDYYSIIDESGNNIFSGNNSKFFISGLAYDPEYDIIPAYIYTDDAMKIRKYGLINLYGEQRLEPVFDFVGDINGKYVIVWDTADDIRGYYTKGVIELVY